MGVPFVSGRDYFEASEFVEKGYRETLEPKSNRHSLILPQFNYNLEQFYQTVRERRSARNFRKQFISKDDFLQIYRNISQPIPTASFEDLEIYSVVNRVEGMEAGFYRGMELIKEGDFRDG